MHYDKKETMKTSLKIAVFWMFAITDFGAYLIHYMHY